VRHRHADLAQPVLRLALLQQIQRRQRGRTGRRAQLAAWIYRVNERPTPVPTPDFAALIPGCSDPAATCAVDFTTLSTLIYNVDATEAALAASLGRPLDYQPALEP
jgi:hypothetical protein